MEAKRVEGRAEGLPRVLALDGVAAAGIEVLRSVADVEVRKTITQEELQQILRTAELSPLAELDALIVRSATTVTESLIKRGSKLKVIGRAGVGVDNICLDAATARGIYVVNSPQGNTIAAAELALGFMFALSRRICLADESVSRSEWERSRFQGAQLHGKTLGVVGLGQVGSYIARVCSFMDMEVLAYDPFINEAKAKALGVSTVSFEHLLSHSDVITLHVPLIESTQRLIRDETLKLMKPQALLINTSRGGVVDEAAVAAALREGRLGGAALDVFTEEKAFDPSNPLLAAKRQGANLILTPHIGASTQEAQINVSLDVAQQVKHILLGELPKSAVNLPSVRLSDLPRTARYIKHAEILGRLCSQLLRLPVETLTLKVSGHIEDGELDVLLLAVAQGLLATRCEHRVNFVNVRKLASEHKIELSAAKVYGPSGALYLEVCVGSQAETASISACSNAEGVLLLRQFKSMPIAFCMPRINPMSPPASEAVSPGSNSNAAAEEAAAGKGTREADLSAGRHKHAAAESQRPIYLFYTIHVDKPGVLATILSVLSSAQINVANCHLGRRCREETPAAATAAGRGEGDELSPREVLGMCIFHTDSAVSEELLDRIRALDFVLEALLFATPVTLGQRLIGPAAAAAAGAGAAAAGAK